MRKYVNIISIIIVLFIAVSCSKVEEMDNKVLESNIEILGENVQECVENNKVDTTSNLIKVVEKFLGREEGINVYAYPENDIIVEGTTYNYVEVVFGDKPAASLFVDIKNELLFNGFGDIDINNPLEFNRTVTIDDLEKEEIIIDAEQSFWVDFESWGKVRFLSCISKSQSRWKSKFYLTNDEKVIVYNFPQHYGDKFWVLEKAKAVSFKDVDNDGDKDL